MDMKQTIAVMRRAPLFSSLDAETVGSIASAMRQREVPAGEVIYKQDAQGDSMLVVLRGRVGVRFKRKDGEWIKVSASGPGSVLGELSFLDPAARAAQVEALEPCLVAVLDRMVLESLYTTAPIVAAALLRGAIRIVTSRSQSLEERIWAALEALGSTEERPSTDGGRPAPPRGEPYQQAMDFSNVPLPRGLTAGDLETLSGAGRLLSFGPSDDLCQEGERGLTCFVVLQGQVDVLRVKGTRARRLARLGPGSLLGQIALVADIPRTATLRSAGDLVVLELSRNIFENLLRADQPLAIRFQEQIVVAGIRQHRAVLKRLEHVALTRDGKAPPARKKPPTPEAATAAHLTAEPTPTPAPAPPRPRRPAQRPASPAAPSSPPVAKPRKGVSQLETTSGLDNLMDNLDTYLASLGEWGITEEELDAAEVAQPDGLMSQAELKARRLLQGT